VCRNITPGVDLAIICSYIPDFSNRGCSMQRLSLAVVVFGMATSAVMARQQEAAANAGKKLTPETSLDLRTISDLQFSPDGTRVAFVVTEPPSAERRARHIWIYNKDSGAVRQFTFSAKDEFRRAGRPMESSLRFSLIARTSSRST
jgi:hypothetical protein